MDLNYFREVGQKYRNIFVHFLVQLKTSKSNSEIIWPLVAVILKKGKLFMNVTYIVIWRLSFKMYLRAWNIQECAMLAPVQYVYLDCQCVIHLLGFSHPLGTKNVFLHFRSRIALISRMKTIVPPTHPFVFQWKSFFPHYLTVNELLTGNGST